MFTTRYVKELPGLYSKVMPTPLADTYWVGWNDRLAEQLGLPVEPDDALKSVLSGAGLFQGHEPIAQKYAGHQFGGWNPGLGDGRGLLLGEWTDPNRQVWEMHLKGAGKTPYSRFGDGRAVLRSSIREFLGSEAMHALGIATTRALALVGSSERVYRETVEPGATLLRLTHSHVRFGHFEWLAFSNQPDQLQILVDYVIRHHYPQCADADDPVVALLEQVVANTAVLIAGWQAYGFVHGVMNTDNMSILGETFDYGPYAFMDATKMNAVFNHTDETGRYAFNQQPAVGLWNLQRLAQALSVLTDPHALAAPLREYADLQRDAYHGLLNRRLGGSNEAPLDSALLDEWISLLAAEQKDFHLFFRALADRPLSEWVALGDEFVDRARFLTWCEAVSSRVIQDDTARQHQMQQTNPVTVARTHHLQAVIEAAHQGDFKPFESLFAALQSPFEVRPEWATWAQPPDDPHAHVELSCSS
ncbi:MAG: YdiU family protein [Reinekea sp.]|nr:YdiU family protein [Reinekea sp.]